MNLDIYNEDKLARSLHVQRKHEWDIERDIDWAQGVDTSKYLLPISSTSKLLPKLSGKQRLALSQLMGLIVSSSIAELEAVSLRLKVPTWDKLMDKYPVNPELRELGEQFYKEEAKHSEAFKRYIAQFAQTIGVELSDLESFLPQTNNSMIEKVYKANAELGGKAMWWLMCAAEEKSILFYHYIKQHPAEVDPLFLKLHKCHFEEEVRHASYAPMMLEVYNEFSFGPQKVLANKVDFILAEVLNMSWTFGQLLKVSKLKKLKSKNPFFETLHSMLEVIGENKPLEIVHELFTSTPYISEMLHLSEHSNVKKLLEKYQSANIPLPKITKMDLQCSV